MSYSIELTYEIVETIVLKELKLCRQNFVDDLARGNARVFSIDPEEDAVEIQKRVDALDLIISWYSVPE
jgi:hypothetical protein